MENNSIIKGTLNLDDLPFLKDYDQLKTRLSIRLNSPTRVKPDAVTMPFRDLSITFHIDVSDVVGKENASCKVDTFFSQLRMDVGTVRLHVNLRFLQTFRIKKPIEPLVGEFLLERPADSFRVS